MMKWINNIASLSCLILIHVSCFAAQQTQFVDEVDEMSLNEGSQTYQVVFIGSPGIYSVPKARASVPCLLESAIHSKRVSVQVDFDRREVLSCKAI